MLEKAVYNISGSRLPVTLTENPIEQVRLHINIDLSERQRYHAT